MSRFLLPLASRYGAIIIQFIVVSLIANRVSLEDAGLYFIIFGSILSTYFIAGFGLPDGVVRLVPPLYEQGRVEEAKRLLGTAAAASWLFSLPLAALFSLAVSWLSGSATLGILSGLWWLSYATVFIGSQVLVASGSVQAGTFAFYSSINIGLFVVVVPMLAVSDKLPLASVLAASCVAAWIAASIVVVLTTRRTGMPRTISIASLQDYWNAGLPIGLGRIVQAVIIWSPVWISGALLGHADAALVGLAMRLVSSISAVLSAVRFSIRPELARHSAANRWDVVQRLGANIAFWTTGLAIIAIVGDLLLGQLIIGTVFGAAYDFVWVLVAIALLGTVGESLGGPVDEILKMSGRAAVVFRAQLAALALSVLTQIAAASLWGIAGLLVAYSASFSALYLYFIAYLLRDKGINVMARVQPGMIDNLLRWLRYFRHIPPSRILGKLRHKKITRELKSRPSRLSSLPVPLDVFASSKLKRFADVYKHLGDRFLDADKMFEGVFVSKGIEHDFGSVQNMTWDTPFPGDTSKIHWSHDISFFSFALPLARRDPEKTQYLLRELVNQLEARHPFAANNKIHFVWSPIALSLRIMGLSTAMALIHAQVEEVDRVSFQVVAQHVAKCAAILGRTSERYLGYNHHVFGETALFVACLALGQSPTSHLSSAVSALGTHVLPDGMWAERSPTYHVHMLMLAKAMLSSEAATGETSVLLSQLVDRMESALTCVVHPDGEIAVFNDAAIEDAVAPEVLGWTPRADEIILLPEAGYVRICQGGTTAIFDAGPMGPDDVIGHGHGDFLSIEVSIGKERLFVDPGVASITSDEARNWTRSAANHNGPTIEGLEPAEFFGAWRVGRRGRAWFDSNPRKDESGTIAVSGICNGYKREAGLVSRSLKLDPSGELLICDRWPAGTGEKAMSCFIVPGHFSVTAVNGNSLELSSKANTKVLLDVTCGSVEIVPTKYYPFGPMKPLTGSMLLFKGSSDQLRVRLQQSSSWVHGAPLK